MKDHRPSVAILNSPRQGGPLRWSKDLVAFLNASGSYDARHIVGLSRLLTAHIAPPADLVHAAVPFFAHLWHRPYVLTVKGDYTIEGGFWRQCYRLALKRANAVTVPSQYLKDRIPELKDAVVIPNAVDLNKFQQTMLKERDEIHAVIVTNFWFPEKARGISKLLELVRTVTGNIQAPLRITVVGAGAYLDRVRTSVPAGLPIHFVGWDDPKKYFVDADLFLYYSYHDNMPNAILEAMASGLPVLTNQVGAVREMIRSGVDGMIAGSDEEYQQHFQALLGSYDVRIRLGVVARRTIETRFDWKLVVGSYCSLYGTLMHKV